MSWSIQLFAVLPILFTVKTKRQTKTIRPHKTRVNHVRALLDRFGVFFKISVGVPSLDSFVCVWQTHRRLNNNSRNLAFLWGFVIGYRKLCKRKKNNAILVAHAQRQFFIVFVFMSVNIILQFELFFNKITVQSKMILLKLDFCSIFRERFY